MIFCVLFVLSSTFIFSPLNLILFFNCTLSAKVTTADILATRKGLEKVILCVNHLLQEDRSSKSLTTWRLEPGFLDGHQHEKKLRFKKQHSSSTLQLQVLAPPRQEKQLRLNSIPLLISSTEAVHVQICRTKGKHTWAQLPPAESSST